MTTPSRINPLIQLYPRTAWAYDCCKCQQQHTDREPAYNEHLIHQSKHGLRQVRIPRDFVPH